MAPNSELSKDKIQYKMVIIDYGTSFVLTVLHNFKQFPGDV